MSDKITRKRFAMIVAAASKLGAVYIPVHSNHDATHAVVSDVAGLVKSDYDPETIKNAKKALQAIREIDGLEDVIVNAVAEIEELKDMKTLNSADVRRLTGKAAYGMREAVREHLGRNGFYSHEGQPIRGIEAVFLFSSSYNTRFGLATKRYFATDDGHLFTSTAKLDGPLKFLQRYHFTDGKVKARDSWNSYDITVVSRLSVIEV